MAPSDQRTLSAASELDADAYGFEKPTPPPSYMQFSDGSQTSGAKVQVRGKGGFEGILAHIADLRMLGVDDGRVDIDCDSKLARAISFMYRPLPESDRTSSSVVPVT
jgi:hypothetical protein